MMPAVNQALYLLGASAFVNILSTYTCNFNGIKTDPRDECQTFVSFLNILFILGFFAVGYLAMKK